MIKIAICDDSRDEISRLKWAMLDVKGDYDADAYETGKALLDAIGKGKKYDLLFCDIYMNGENGVEIAKEVRFLSPATAIVFTTTSTEHAVEAFSISALHYIVKPVRPEDVAEVFRRMSVKQEPRKTLTLRIDRAINVLYQDEITRVEGQNHKTLIVCLKDAVFPIWKPFREVCELLDDSFVGIKKGVAVNMRHIAKMTARECFMKDGNVFLLRRDQAKEIREKYYAYVEKELDKN
jgi:DNA-binding LytR/AlgR family response regulator